MRVTVTFSLDSEHDRDLLQWLDGLPWRERSAAIRAALRRDLSSEVQLADVLAAVHDLGARLQWGAVAPTEETATDEPPEAAAALDELGL